MGRAQKRKKQPDRPSAAKSAEGGSPKPKASRLSARSFAPVALLVLVTIAVYANSFSVPFLFDDYFVIVGNDEIQSLEPVERFFTRSRGIPHLLDTLNYLWDGEEVWGFHLVNLVVHTANVLLVYALALLTLRLPMHGGRYDRRAVVLATLTALVFAVHPLQTMAVTYIVQRAESTAAMFYLTAMLVFAAGASGRIRLSGFALGVVLLALGLVGIMSKETVASLPAALLLYYLCFLRGGRSDRSSGDWRPLALAALPILYGVYLARHFLIPGLADPAGGQSAWMYIPTAGLQLEGITPATYLMTQFGVVVWYLRLYLLPTHLCFDYGWPFVSDPTSGAVLAPLALLLGLVVVAVVTYRRTPWLAFGIGWFFITLAPSSSIIPIKDAAFEYRMYLPIFGLSLMVIAGFADLLHRLARGGAAYERFGAIAAVLCVVALGAGTVERNRTLQSEMSLARDSAAKAPLHWRNQYALGSALVQERKYEEAVEPLARAIELNPSHHTPRIQLGVLYSQMGRLEEAEDVLLPATDAREESVSAAAYRQLGMIYKARNYPEAAIGMFEEAVARKPKWYPVELQIVRLRRHLGDWHDAAYRLNNLIAANPTYTTRMAGEIAEINLLGGVQSYEQGWPDFARKMLSLASEHPTTMAVALHYLAYVEAESGDRAAAARILEDLSRRGLGGEKVTVNLARLGAGEPLQAPTSTRELR